MVKVKSIFNNIGVLNICSHIGTSLQERLSGLFIPVIYDLLFWKSLILGWMFLFPQLKDQKKEKKVIPRGAMGEQFEEDGTVQAREQLNGRQGIYLKLK